MVNVLVVLCFAALTLAANYPPEGEVNTKNARLRDRLPVDVTPVSYNIVLEPDIKASKFTGTVSIQIKFVNKVKKIVLHSDKLVVNDKNTKITCTSEFKITKVTQNEDNKFLTIDLDKDVDAGSICTLSFDKYTGTLSDTERSGLYLAKYMEDGKQKVFATTQFQETGARMAFPCFDEPHFKATFDVTLIRGKEYVTISNEELERSEDIEGNKVQDVYKTTRVMSTYLLAFIVTEYGATEVKQGQRVFADKPAITNGDATFALDMGIEVLSALEKYTEFRFTFGKMDQIAIPDGYFAPGAMENWGLVTYRKSLLVYPYDQQVTKGFQKTVSIIAHEFAHQWFGNLVTCDWWDHIWLNEGFADYFEYFASAMVGWDIRDLFVIDSVHGALRQDSVKTIKPMNSEEASTIIIYQKAGSVIRMMSHIVTEDVFQKSLALYLRANQYKSSNPPKLYQAFETIIEQQNKTNLLGGRTLSEIMQTWDSQAGYPVLIVTKTNEKITLQQKRFFTDGTTEDQTKWIIPLTYVVEGDTENDFSTTTANDWMADTTKEIQRKSDGWVIFNKQQSGYYRVKYDDENWNLLVNQLSERDHTQIHVLNRVQLIDDAFTFIQLDQMNYTQVLDLSKYLVKEQEYVPIAVFIKYIIEINTKLAEDNNRDHFKFYLENLLSGSALETVTLMEKETDSLQTEYLRIELINWLCRLGNEQCLTHALDTFKKHSIISPNLQTPIYCGAMRTGSQEDWNFLFEKLKQETNDLSRARIINGLGCSENSDILKGYTVKILDLSNNIDIVSGFRSIMNAGDFGIEFVLNYTSTDFDKIKSKSGSQTIILDLAAKLNNEQQEQLFTVLAEENSDLSTVFDEAKTKIKANRDWNKEHGGYISTWFSQYRSSIDNSALVPTANLSFLAATVLITFLANFV